jgi:hypothetical protein
VTPCVVGDRAQRVGARRAESLEARELQLDGDTCLRRGLEQRAAVRDHGRTHRVAAALVILASSDGPQLARVRIQAEHDLGLALGNALGELLGEAQRLAQRPFTALLRPLPAVNRGTRDAAI